MRRSILLMLVPAFVLAGCGRPVVHETVVERPVVTKETVVERPAIAGSTGSACTYASTVYSNGTMSCQGGYQYRCNNGLWDSTSVAC